MSSTIKRVEKSSDCVFMEANLAWRASSCIRQGERGRCHYDEVAVFAKWDLSTIGRVLEASSRIRNQPAQRSLRSVRIAFRRKMKCRRDLAGPRAADWHQRDHVLRPGQH